MSLKDQLAQQQAALGGFKKQAASVDAGELIQGVSVPVSIDRNGAKLRLHINLSPAVLSSPDMLNAVLDELETIFDLDTWQAKNQTSSQGGFKQSGNNYGNSNGYQNGGNYSRNNYNGGSWRR